MTDNEIKSALKCAILNAKGYGSKVWSIEVYKLENTLDLINRLKAENEELVGNIDRLKEENGNLTVEFQAMRNAANGFKNELFDKTELLKTATDRKSVV